MAYRIKQFRYYKDSDTKNSDGLNSNKLIKGSFLEGLSIVSIIKLGIQTYPGTRFYLNGNTKCPITIGKTGIYDLDLNGGIDITSVSFDSASINNLTSLNNPYLIIDIVYDEES